ncbi:MAG: hypothetical protein V2A79_01690 [Planctomycetota bacterium]
MEKKDEDASIRAYGSVLHSPFSILHSPFLLTLTGVAFSVGLALASDGAYHDDALTHYLYSRWAWNDARYLLDEWGRPGLTALLVPFARFGWTACRLESAVLSGAAVWFAYLTAARLEMRHAVFVVPLAFCQPLFVMLSYDTMTETAVALYLSLALWLFVSGRPTASAVVLSLCFVTRYETLVFGPLWWIALRSVRARWYAYAAVAWAPAAHNLLGVLLLGRWPLAFILSGPLQDEYGSGTALSMLIKSLAAAGPTVGLLALVGCLLPWRRRGTWLVPAVYVVHLLTQTTIYWSGAYASGGYPRFFVSTAPVAAVVALHALNHLVAREPAAQRRALAALAAIMLGAWIGLEIEPLPRDEVWILVLDKLRPIARAVGAVSIVATLIGAIPTGERAARWRGRMLGLLALLGSAGAVGPAAYLVRPHRSSPDASDIASAVGWLRAAGFTPALDGGGEPRRSPLITTNIWTSYFLGSDRNLTATPGNPLLAGVTRGSVLLWDADYSPGARFGISLDKLAANQAWHLKWSSRPRADGTVFARIYRYEPAP